LTINIIIGIIIQIIENTNLDVLVDLGGGTGYILSELIHKGISENIKLINLDLSDAQIAQIPLLTKEGCALARGGSQFNKNRFFQIIAGFYYNK